MIQDDSRVLGTQWITVSVIATSLFNKIPTFQPLAIFSGKGCENFRYLNHAMEDIRHLPGHRLHAVYHHGFSLTTLKLPCASCEPVVLTIPQDLFSWCLLTAGPTSRPKEYNKQEMYGDPPAANA